MPSWLAEQFQLRQGHAPPLLSSKQTCYLRLLATPTLTPTPPHQCGYLHLRNDDLAASTAFRELLGPEGAREVAAAADPVLLCLYRMLAVDSKYEKWR